MSENAVLERKKLSKKDLANVFLRWQVGTESCNSYERLMSLGFCWSMLPVINKFYPDGEEKKAALKRHLAFFNTENNWGAFIPGIVCSMEEDRASGMPITDEMINGVKVGLMGPLAGLGDTITQTLVRVVFLSITINMALNGNYFAPVLFIILYTAYIIGIGYFTFTKGYQLGKDALSKITDSTILKKITECLSILGMTIAGSMIVSNANVSTPLVIKAGESSVVLNDVLSEIAPNIIGVATVVTVFALLRKGVSVNKLIIGIFVIGFLLSLVGIL